MEKLQSDVTIVGAGIAGLWSAKELIDRGASVTILEKESTLANGATTRNEGWLHAGTYHSVAVENEEEAHRVTERTVYGHNAIINFAPESIDHKRSYALIADDDLMERALLRWNLADITHREVNPKVLRDNESVDTTLTKGAFEVQDKSVNSVKLCQKLAKYITEHGGKFITNASFIPNDNTSARVYVGNENSLDLISDHFLITTGCGTKDVIERITGQSVLMRYFQAHLLITPRATKDNLFYMDVGEAGIMNHESVSVIGINKDGIQLTEPDYQPVPSKERLVFNALTRILPKMNMLNTNSMNMVGVACCKPDIYKSIEDTQSLNVQMFEPAEGYLCALPGKMTESPYLGLQAAKHILNSDTLVQASNACKRSAPAITPRPADHFMELIISAS